MPNAGAASTAAGSQASPQRVPAPLHRYDFAGTGRVAFDRIAGADAQLRGGCTLNDTGAVQFDGSAGTAVELPEAILSGLTSFTLLGWIELRSQDCWQRLFDFSFNRERQTQDGQTVRDVSALYATPRSCPDQLPTVGYVTEQSRDRLQSDRPAAEPQRMLLGATYESATGALHLVVDGSVRNRTSVNIGLPELGRSVGYLGRSYYPSDPTLNGSISEFRIYGEALDEKALEEVARLGPDQL